MRLASLSILLLCALVSVQSGAEVTAASENGFVSSHRLVLKGTVADAYRALTDEIASWWDGSHSFSGDAANFSLDARAGGCFCEELPGGGEVEHMRVVYADPAGTLRLNGGLGPLQEMAVTGSMLFNLSAQGDDETVLSYTYSVSGFVPGGLAVFAEPVDQVQLGQLQRLQAYLAAQ